MWPTLPRVPRGLVSRLCSLGRRTARGCLGPDEGACVYERGAAAAFTPTALGMARIYTERRQEAGPDRNGDGWKPAERLLEHVCGCCASSWPNAPFLSFIPKIPAGPSWPRRSGAVGRRSERRADVNRAAGAADTQGGGGGGCCACVTRRSVTAGLTPIWSRVDGKVDRCFTDVHYL